MCVNQARCVFPRYWMHRVVVFLSLNVVPYLSNCEDPRIDTSSTWFRVLCIVSVVACMLRLCILTLLYTVAVDSDHYHRVHRSLFQGVSESVVGFGSHGESWLRSRVQDLCICEQNTLTRHIFSCFSAAHITVSHMTLAQGVLRTSSHPCLMWLCVLILFDSPLCTLHSLSHLLPHSHDFHLHPHLTCVSVRRESTLCVSANEEPDSFVNNATLTGYEPKFFDDYHISETTEIFIQESSSDSRPSNLHDLEIDDYTFGRALSSPLFTQEREEPASRRQAYRSPEESLSSSQSLSVGHVRTGRPVSDEYHSLISNVRENPRRDSEN